MLRYAKQVSPTNIANHHTPAPLARYLVGQVPLRRSDTVIDPCAGSNRVFFNAFPGRKIRCELADGTDFFDRAYRYDWSITNPPYHLLWRFIDKTSLEARRGFGFLVNINGINTLTPKRLELLAERGFVLRQLYICNVKQWFGRYYFYTFMKEPGACRVAWSKQSW